MLCICRKSTWRRTNQNDIHSQPNNSTTTTMAKKRAGNRIRSSKIYFAVQLNMRHIREPRTLTQFPIRFMNHERWIPSPHIILFVYIRACLSGSCRRPRPQTRTFARECDVREVMWKKKVEEFFFDIRTRRRKMTKHFICKHHSMKSLLFIFLFPSFAHKFLSTMGKSSVYTCRASTRGWTKKALSVFFWRMIDKFSDSEYKMRIMTTKTLNREKKSNNEQKREV